MHPRKTTITWFLLATSILARGLESPIVSAQQQPEKPFTVADEIGLTLFGDPNGGPPQVHFSPDGKYFAVWTERGRLDVNRVEDSLRFYRSQDVVYSLQHPDSKPPSAAWVVSLSTNTQGPIISDWRWLPDSSGVAFLECMAVGNRRLVLADLSKKTIELLTPVSHVIKVFDIRDRQHYVYAVADPVEVAKSHAERDGPATVGTGHSIYELLFPDSPSGGRDSVSPQHNNCTLWAVVGVRRFEVKHDRPPFVTLTVTDDSLALSPDGRSLVTTLPVPDVPTSWEMLYPPPFASDFFRIHAGNREVQPRGVTVRQYVLINLLTGSVRALTDAPISSDAGWWVTATPSWSTDGQAVLLPGTFLRSKDQAPSWPCVAVVDITSRSAACVEMLRRRTIGPSVNEVEKDYHTIRDVRFAGGDKGHVIDSFSNSDHSPQTIEYRQTADGRWQVTVPSSDGQGKRLSVTVKQGVNQPPLLFAMNKQASRIIWDPNPQLERINLTDASVYTWQDKKGQDWSGLLFKPSNYHPGQRYPLVIQGHGFTEFEFRPSGVFPTAFAARALAAAGIAVLQIKDSDGRCLLVTVDEGACAVAGYEAAVSQLISDGLVDPGRIGMIGFSRTCFYVMETLTTASFHVKAASITDGVTLSYFQYLQRNESTFIPHEGDVMIGARPFGGGLQLWLKRSPTFNLDKVNTPLLVVGEGPSSVLFMWEPYAGLRYLQKPVELIMLNTDEHVLTNPNVRMASQGGSVDWFRFWLKDEEDPDSTKAEQYARWRRLRQLQENKENSISPQSASSYLDSKGGQEQ
jgi:dipeptidyl aminopeptidase/acylaminoacyl peptidase